MDILENKEIVVCVCCYFDGPMTVRRVGRHYSSMMTELVSIFDYNLHLMTLVDEVDSTAAAASLTAVMRWIASIFGVVVLKVVAVAEEAAAPR